MSAVVIGKDNPTVDGFATTGLTFNHALSAVKFVAGDDLPNCVVKSIKLDGVRYKGGWQRRDPLHDAADIVRRREDRGGAE